MKTVKLFTFALFIVSMFAFSACEEESIVVKSEDGEEQQEDPIDID